MKRVVKYISIDPFYSDVVQTYIGANSDEIDNIQDETERYMKNCHSSLNVLYKREVIAYEQDIDKEIKQ